MQIGAGAGRHCLMGNRLYFGVKETVGHTSGQRPHSIVSPLSSSKLLTQKWPVLCYGKFTCTSYFKNHFKILPPLACEAHQLWVRAFGLCGVQPSERSSRSTPPHRGPLPSSALESWGGLGPTSTMLLVPARPVN